MTAEAPAQRICLVTGGGGGLGTEVCRALAQTGAYVVVVDIAAERAAAVVETLEQAQFCGSYAVCDVSRADAVQDLRDRIIQEHGRLDILINLAGTIRNAVLTKVMDEDFLLTMASHAHATLNTMRAFAPNMKANHYGRIVNTSSIAVLGAVAATSYSAAKGAIEGMSRSAAIELAAHGITVNCVAPGVIATGMFLTTPKEFQENLIARTPMRRAGRPQEIAACIRFLASEEASFVTGQTLFACGGVSLGGFG
jgi:3-oxoacyl-[acyl-carrier protein] reductase